MSGDEAAVAVTMIITAGATVITVARMYFKHLEAKTRGFAPTRGGAREAIGEERLERIEQAVDAIALEVERMSEGQRFTTRLLAERMQEPAGPAGGTRDR
jgi:hypothetical protein